jgi:Na+/citrate or Na+/malate symporter
MYNEQLTTIVNKDRIKRIKQRGQAKDTFSKNYKLTNYTLGSICLLTQTLYLAQSALHDYTELPVLSLNITF